MENLPSNRMELQKRKKRLTQAEKGLKLLKDKLEALMAEFLTLARRYMEQKSGVFERLIIAQGKFALAQARYPELINAGMSSFSRLELQNSETRLMTLILPKFDITVYEPDTALPPQIATTSAIEALSSYQEILPNLVKVGELQSSLRYLAIEIQATRRRTNALEHVMIPRLNSEVTSIQSKLDEYDRAGKSRLLRIKDILSKKK
jgi:V/A-type H+-transporting ATPase subunit D